MLAPVIPHLSIAIDTGGTFTDCVYRNRGRIEVLKLPSTPDDPSRAILEAVRRVCELVPARRVEVRHGTTVATNALLERKGARVAFVTTAGFEDTLAIARQARPNLYDWNQHRPAPITSLTFGVPERIAPDGSVLLAPSKSALANLRGAINDSEAESIAVSLLFSFANSAHEQAVAEALASLRLPISLSHQILPEFREYERGSTVALNAYLAPRMQSYIRALERGLEKRSAALSIMQSSGGILSAASAAREPVRTILSGPAGGVIGALSVARIAGIDRILTFDMGGTSTDVALLDANREPPTTSEGQVEGLPVSIPMLDIHTAGAGGGSLAWMDSAGALHAGPQSAGADPGPACYGRGERATVTDANLVLGRLHPDYFLGGAMRLDEARAHKALSAIPHRSFASLEHFAEGIIRVANARMESALRRVSVERGFDPRTFTLLAFGGAGPLHACALAESLGIRRVLIPAAPGALSALGILDADLRREFSRTVMLAPASPQISEVFPALEAEARAAFASESARPILKRSADLRYHGQGYELRIDWSADAFSRFHKLHEQTYGYSDAARSVEIVTLRVQAIARSPKPHVPQAKKGSESCAPFIAQSHRAMSGNTHRIFENGRWRKAALYDRAQLAPGNRLTGPAVIAELSATTYLPTGWEASIDAQSNLILTPNARSRQ
ncbi:hydantoinase/oxoprolinase family protein [Occallatibacter savannae]|uniref:hydantoinase/oxoprolinase family protein n=1 Tax=Occallatibacter savannae TaxID=1002691 RepID=UPI000D68F66A|nr:hydantoinase/oxoprolinase family protein [Occallatibacter savannae]